MTTAPTGSNADEWALFLSEWGTAYCAVQIAEAIEAAEQRGYARGIEAAASRIAPSNPRSDWTDYARDCHHLANMIRDLSPTPPALVTVQEAARVLRDAPELMEGWSEDGWADICALAENEGPSAPPRSGIE